MGQGVVSQFISIQWPFVTAENSGTFVQIRAGGSDLPGVPRIA